MYILTAVLSGNVKGLGARLQDSFFLTWLRSLQVGNFRVSKRR